MTQLSYTEEAMTAKGIESPPAFTAGAVSGWTELDDIVHRWSSLPVDEFTEAANKLTLDQLREGIAQAQAANAEHLVRAEMAFHLEARLREAAGNASAYRSRDEVGPASPR